MRQAIPPEISHSSRSPTFEQRLCLLVFLSSSDYTHIISLGTNDLFQAAEAITRYAIGGGGYVDPVDFELLFQINNVTGFPVLDDTGLPVPNFEPVVEVRFARSCVTHRRCRRHVLVFCFQLSFFCSFICKLRVAARTIISAGLSVSPLLVVVKF